MVVGLFGTGFPFVNRSTAAFGFDEVLGRDLFGEHSVLLGAITENGKTSVVAHRHGKAGVREGLPPVRVVDDVADGSLAIDCRHSPVQSDAVAGSAFVFAEADAEGESHTISINPKTTPVASTMGQITDRLLSTGCCFNRIGQLVVIRNENIDPVLSSAELTGLLNQHVEFKYISHEGTEYKPLSPNRWLTPSCLNP